MKDRQCPKQSWPKAVLKGKWTSKGVGPQSAGQGLTCSNSSVMVLGSSCLWNHIIYLVWNRHDCFFRALAARYCALVPWGGGWSRDQGVPKLGGVMGIGQGIRADPRLCHRPRWG